MKTIRYNDTTVLILFDRTTGSGTRLADYIETLTRGAIEPTAVQWNRQTQTGHITCRCTPEQQTELERLLANYLCPKA